MTSPTYVGEYLENLLENPATPLSAIWVRITCRKRGACIVLRHAAKTHVRWLVSGGCSRSLPDMPKVVPIPQIGDAISWTQQAFGITGYIQTRPAGMFRSSCTSVSRCWDT